LRNKYRFRIKFPRSCIIIAKRQELPTKGRGLGIKGKKREVFRPPPPLSPLPFIDFDRLCTIEARQAFNPEKNLAGVGWGWGRGGCKRIPAAPETNKA